MSSLDQLLRLFVRSIRSSDGSEAMPVFMEAIEQRVFLSAGPFVPAPLAAAPALTAPAGVRASATGPNRVELTWTDRSRNETGFRVERSVDGSPFVAVGTVRANAQRFVDKGLLDGMRYAYRVRAISGARASAASGPASATTPVSAGLLGYWKLDEGGGTTAADSSGAGRDGSVNGEVSWTGGKLGSSAASFHGTGNAISHIAVDDSAPLRFGADDSFTIAAWVKPLTARPVRQAIVSSAVETGQGYGVFIDPQNRFSFVGSSSTISGGKATARWHHVVAVQDAAAEARRLYVDGVRVATGDAQEGGGAGAFWIGDVNVDGESFRGQIDEVRAWGRAIGDAEAKALARNSKPVAPAKVTARSTSGTAAQLRWNDLANNETGFVVERSTDGVNFRSAGLAKANATSFQATGLARNRVYYFRVRALNGYGISEEEPAVMVRTARA